MTGSAFADRLQSAGVEYKEIGENIAENTNAPDPAQTAVDGWMRSPGHRESILRPAFTETGVGISQQGRPYFFTQEFLRPR